VYNQTTNQKVNYGPNIKKNLINFPYVFEVDRYLPIFRVYDQNKTLIKEYSVLPEEIPNTLDYLACPDFTYSFRGTCVLECPKAYFHYMNGTKGACTLSPFSDSNFIINPVRLMTNTSNNELNYK
jgi:hypothetical protein